MSNTDNLIEELITRLKDAPYDHLLARVAERLRTLNSENAQLKANNVELVEALENIIDLAESIRLSGDAGDWCWEEGDEFTTAVQLLRKVRGSDERNTTRTVMEKVSNTQTVQTADSTGQT